MTEHKWAHILRDIADGKEVEFYSEALEKWFTPGEEEDNPITYPDWEWRVKPTEQEKPMAPTPHPHAANLAEYAQDAALDGEAWKNLEYKNQGGAWRPLQNSPIWHPDCEYRRKPPAVKMIRVTTHSGRVYEFPEPMKTAPADRTEYFVVEISENHMVANTVWNTHSIDLRWLEKGICHLSREAAEQHAAALLAVNRGE